MYRRRRPISSSRFFDTVGDGIAAAAFFCVVVGFIAGVVFALVVDSANASASDNRTFMNMLNSSGTGEPDLSSDGSTRRQEFARQFVNINDATSVGYDYLALSDDQWKQAKMVADTGKPAKLDTDKMHFMSVFDGWLKFAWILGFMTILGIGALIKYADSNGYDGYYWADPKTRIADLPWKSQLWPWLITLVLGPVFWVTMAVSAALLHWTPYEAEREEREEHDPWPDRRDDVRAITEAVMGDLFTDTVKGRTIEKTYPSSPVAARDSYVSIRTHAALEYRDRALNEARENLSYYERNARSLGESLRETQGSINELRATCKRLEETAGADAPVSPDLAGEEFDRIAQLPGVISTQAVNGGLRVIVRAQRLYKEALYDLGDWRIDIAADTAHIRARELRSGVRRNWNGNYPVYRLGEGNFCFGDREYIIDEHLRKGQYLEALAIAVESLNGVNKGDRKSIPDAFHLVNA